MRFYIPKFNLSKLEKLVNRLKRKTDINFEVIPDSERLNSVVIDGVTYRYREVEVDLDVDYKVGDYELIAELEHTPNGNIIRKINLDSNVPERYRTTDCYCDHCHTNRDRKNTFLLVDNNGDYKQVGKSCLNDYTGYDSLSIARDASSLYRIFKYAENKDFEDDPEFYEFLKQTQDRYSPLKTMANLFYQILLDKGYDKYNPFEGLSSYSYKPELENKVDELLNVVNTDWYDDRNDYCHNVKTVLGMEYIEPKHYKILISYLNSALQYLERHRGQRGLFPNQNNYLGEVGDKISFTISSIRVLFSGYSTYGYNNSVETFTYRFTTPEGNVVLWTTAKEMNEDYIGCKVTGTIKSLKEYKGEKQTIITRAKVDEEAAANNRNARLEQERQRQEEERLRREEQRRAEDEKNEWIVDYCEKNNLIYWHPEDAAIAEKAWEEHNKENTSYSLRDAIKELK